MKSCAVVLLGLLLLGGNVSAGDHLVSPTAAGQALRDSATARNEELARLDEVLSSDVAVQAASKVGVDITIVKQRLRTLNDSELSGLAARAAALQEDPVAGMSDKDRKLVIILAIIIFVVPIVILVAAV